MSESKHTPGPWRHLNENVYAPSLGDQNSTTELVASAFASRGASKEGNARLIAAAPELLAMLKVAQLWLDVDGRFDMQGINSAIAKAEGRS